MTKKFWPLSLKLKSVILLVLSQICALSLWFATAAIMVDLQTEFDLSDIQKAGLSSSVQAGFVIGALVLAFFNIADRFDPRRLFALGAVVAASANYALLFSDPATITALILRAITGAALAGVYPVGIKLAAGWGVKDRGMLVGLLVGALTMGSALPHLIALGGDSDWRFVVRLTTILGFLSGFMIMASNLGPYLGKTARFNPRKLGAVWSNKRVRYAYLGYLGHMIELYAMWAWLGVALAEAFTDPFGDDAENIARIVTFTAITIGAVACIWGGRVADRIGKGQLALFALTISGSMGLLTAFLLYTDAPPLLIIISVVVWGASIIPDSPQFSALVADAVPAEDAGSLLILQTALGFFVTIFTVQGLPLVASAFGWPLALALLAVGPMVGIPAMILHQRAERRHLA